MTRRRAILFTAIFFTTAFFTSIRLAKAESAEAQIREVLNQQAAAWNRGDLAVFVESYFDSPKTVFIGKDIARGREHLLERYQKAYSTPEKMGTLSFSDLEIEMLGADYANVLGRFHLARAAAGGGDASGIFTLLFRNTSQGWKIIQDHTSQDQKAQEAPQ